MGTKPQPAIGAASLPLVLMLFHALSNEGETSLPAQEEIPELRIDGDELLDVESDDIRSASVKELLGDSYKPTWAFLGLLNKTWGMQN
ncbi:hypothetical protein GH733_007334 [Mirounga leonina]|nr:hypothetical protein GH733_007334 [Mirounga leonina]